MGWRKPILALVPNGTARNTLQQYQAAFIASPEDVTAIAHALSNIYLDWTTNTLPEPDDSFIQSLDRHHLTGGLAQILNACIDPKGHSES